MLGSEQLEKEMDIIKVIKHIRNVKTFMNNNINDKDKGLLKL